MKLKTSLLISLSLLLMVGTLHAQSEPAQQTILEKYTINPGNSGITKIALSSGNFGGGTAKSAIRFVRGPNSNWLYLHVWRFVKRDETTPALLVFKVSVRGSDSTGRIVYSKDFEGFHFGDSTAGEWSEKINPLPSTVHQIAITFFGNYE